VAVKFRERLSSRLDVDKAVALLVDPLGHRIVNNGLRHKLAIMSLFWRDRLPKA